MASENVTPLPERKGGTSVASAPAPDHGELGPKDNAEVRDALHDAVEETIQLEAKRAEINKNLSAVREGVKARNINMKAFAAALAYYKMPDAHREDFDRDYLVTRKATGMPVEPQLYGLEDAEAGAEENPAPH